jgi:hypothetical protein
MFRTYSDLLQGVLRQTSVYETNMFFEAVLPEYDLKKVDTYCSISGLYVKAYILIFVPLLVLCN